MRKRRWFRLTVPLILSSIISIGRSRKTNAKKRSAVVRKRTEPEVEIVYTIWLEIEFDEEAWKKEKRRVSRFVLVMTVPVDWQEKTMDGKAILGLYKGQVNVEMNFSFLKDPFFTDEIYIKKSERVLVL